MSLLTSKLGTYKSLALGRTDLWKEKKLQALNNGKALRFAFRAYLAHHLEVKSTIYRFAQPSCEWHRVCPMRQLKIVSLIRKYKLNRMYDFLIWCTHVQMPKSCMFCREQEIQNQSLSSGKPFKPCFLSEAIGSQLLSFQATLRKTLKSLNGFILIEFNWHILT